MRVRLYQISICLLAFAALAVTVSSHGVTNWLIVIFLAVLRFLVESFAFRLPLLGSNSLAFPIIFAAVLLEGPTAGAIVAATGAITRQDIEQAKPALTMAFNLAQLSLMGMAGGWVMAMLGLSPLDASSVLPQANLPWLGITLFTALVMAAVNIGLLAVAIAMIRQMPLARVWRESFQDYVLSLLALALLGLLLAELLATSGIPGSLLIVVPFAVAWQTFQVYGQQAEAYRGTVRCLVAAIEAKDPYTRGHSERVAWYARCIASDMGLPDDELKRIEWAALLHDVGKVAISRQTLIKPGALTDSEFQSIREHPEIAVEVLRGVEFLSDIVPYIQAHHERPDGRGYPAGLCEDDLPLGARILAVADSFDAMTSGRAYRRALTYEEACTALDSAAGTQLDADCVLILLRCVDVDVLGRMLLIDGGGAGDA